MSPMAKILGGGNRARPKPSTFGPAPSKKGVGSKPTSMSAGAVSPTVTDMLSRPKHPRRKGYKKTAERLGEGKANLLGPMLMPALQAAAGGGAGPGGPGMPPAGSM